jgi:nucleoside-diphosphate-sugar epimerase
MAASVAIPTSQSGATTLKTLIFGATGTLGIHILHQSLAAGHTVTAFVHTPSTLTVEHANFNVVVGNTALTPVS